LCYGRNAVCWLRSEKQSSRLEAELGARPAQTNCRHRISDNPAPIRMKTFADIGDVLVSVLFLGLPVLIGAAGAWFIRWSGRAGRRRRAATVILGNALLSAFLVSLLLAVGEFYFRFCYDTTDAFGLTRVNQRWFDRHWRPNNAGFRDNVSDYPPTRTPGRRRITFIGDSFTAGHGIPNVEDRFANQIRHLTQDEVHVMAVNGYDTGDEIFVAEELVRQGYQFDQVVLVYVLNDIGDVTDEAYIVDARVRSNPPTNFFIRHSFFLDTYYYWFRGRFDPDVSNYYQFVRKLYNGPTWEAQQKRLLSLRDFIESHGGRFRVVTFPFLHRLGPGYDYRPVHAQLGQFWRDAGVPHLDLLPLFEAHASANWVVNRHDAHPNQAAHALAAKAIAEFLQQDFPPH